MVKKQNPLEKCEKCPDFIFEDVQDYIQKLEANDSQVKKALQDNGFGSLEEFMQAFCQVKADNAKKDETIQMLQDGNASLMNMIDEECEKTVRLERERDAAVKDIRAGDRCFACKKFFHNGGRCSGGRYCVPLDFEWRGVTEPPEEEA